MAETQALNYSVNLWNKKKFHLQKAEAATPMPTESPA